MGEKTERKTKDYKQTPVQHTGVITRLWLTLDRFGLDFIAILLFALFLLSLLGLLGLTHGTFIENGKIYFCIW